MECPACPINKIHRSQECWNIVVREAFRSAVSQAGKGTKGGVAVYILATTAGSKASVFGCKP
jgi:hypothetical protein